MKLIFAYTPNQRCMFPCASFRDVILKLPDTEVIECTDYESVLPHTDDMDIFFVSGLSPLKMTPEQVNELSKLLSDRVLICNTSLDPWTTPRFYSGLRLDVTTSFSYEQYKKMRGWSEKMYWLPNACDLRDYDYQRGIDILLWGKWMHKYPYRMIIKQELDKLIVEPVDVDPLGMARTAIELGGRRYTLAWMTFVATGTGVLYYYSEELYKLISRAKVCPTGPTGYLIPVGKYVEHAACGAVSITPEFTDGKALGWEHGKNIWFTDKAKFKDNFIHDLRYLLEHDDVRQEIVANARKLITERHTTEIRARELYEFFKSKVAGRKSG